MAIAVLGKLFKCINYWDWMENVSGYNAYCVFALSIKDVSQYYWGFTF